MGIRDNQKSPKITGKNYNPKDCVEPDSRIFFCFQHITLKKGYNLDALIEHNGKKKAQKELLKRIKMISEKDWVSLKGQGKTKGGYETMALSEFNKDITDQYDENLSKDTKLIVFRFGDDFRMIGHKKNTCNPNFNILAFDLDYSLYNHGS